MAIEPRKTQPSIDAWPTRCRICGRGIAPGAGLRRNDHVDPLCEQCMSVPVVRRDFERRQEVDECRRWEERYGDVEKIARIAKDTVDAVARKQVDVHGQLGAIRTHIRELHSVVDAALERIERLELLEDRKVDE